MIITEYVLSQIITLSEQNTDIETVWLYGSRATGSTSEHSDFDLAIAFKSFKLSATEKFLRPNELALDWSLATSLPEKLLSIVDINLVPVYLGFNIISDGKVIYNTGTARAINEENRIRSQYEFATMEKSLMGAENE